jgi:hypothetical protein
MIYIDRERPNHTCDLICVFYKQISLFLLRKKKSLYFKIDEGFVVLPKFK